MLIVGLAVVVVASTTSAQAPDDKEPKLSGFTCCNLHYENDWISDANWSSLPMIPAGQPAQITDYGSYRIVLDIDGKKMRLGQDYGRSEPLGQFARRFVVAQDPKPKIASWPAGVREAVKEGKVVLGMTKEQVIVSLGYPPLHQTPSLDAPVGGEGDSPAIVDQLASRRTGSAGPRRERTCRPSFAPSRRAIG